MADSVAGLFVEIEAREAIRTLARLERQSQQTGDQVDRVGGAAAKTSRGLKTADPAAKALAGSLKHVAVAGIAVGASLAAMALTKLTRDALVTGAKFEQLGLRLETLEGSGQRAAAAMELIRKVAADTPFTVDEVTEAYARLRAIGLRPTEDTLKTMADVAAASGKGILDFAEAVVGAATGEMDRLKQFGIIARQEGDEVVFTFNGVETRVAKNAAAITEALLGIGRANFAGGAEKQMQSLDGKMSNLADSWDELVVEIFNSGLGDAVKGSVDVAIDGVKLLSTALKMLALDSARASAEVELQWFKLANGFNGLIVGMLDRLNQLPGPLKALLFPGLSESMKNLAEDMRRQVTVNEQTIDTLKELGVGGDGAGEKIADLSARLAALRAEMDRAKRSTEETAEALEKVHLERVAEIRMDFATTEEIDKFVEEAMAHGVEVAEAALDDFVHYANGIELDPIELPVVLVDRDFDQEIANVDKKTAAKLKESEKRWESTVDDMRDYYRDNMTAAFVDAFAQWVTTGEMSWEALGKSLLSMLQDWIADEILLWIAKEQEKTAITAAGAAERAALERASQAAGGGSGGAGGGGVDAGQAAGLGSSASGASSAALTAAGVVAIFAVFWMLAEDRMNKKKAENFGTEVFGGGAAGVSVGTATRQGLDPTAAGLQAQAMQDQLTMLAYQLGVAGTELGRFSLEFNKMTGQWEAFVNGELVANVNNLEAAWGAIMRAMLDGLQTAGPAMQKMIGEAMKRGAQPAELQALIDLGTKLDMVGVPDVVGEIRQAFMDWVPDANRALAAGVDVGQVIGLLAEQLDDVLGRIRSQIDEFLDPSGAMGRVTAFQDLQAAAIAANAELARTAAAVEDMTASEQARQDVLDNIAGREPVPGQSPGGAEGGSDITPIIRVPDEFYDLDDYLEDLAGPLDNFGGVLGDAGSTATDTGDAVTDALGDISHEGDIVVGTAGDVAEALTGVTEALPDPIDLDELARAQQALSDQLESSLGGSLLQMIDNEQIRARVEQANFQLRMLELEAQYQALVALGTLSPAILAAYREAIDEVQAGGAAGMTQKPSGGGGRFAGGRQQAREDLQQMLADMEAGISGLALEFRDFDAETAQLASDMDALGTFTPEVVARFRELREEMRQLMAAEAFQDLLGQAAQMALAEAERLGDLEAIQDLEETLAGLEEARRIVEMANLKAQTQMLLEQGILTEEQANNVLGLIAQAQDLLAQPTPEPDAGDQPQRPRGPDYGADVVQELAGFVPSLARVLELQKITDFFSTLHDQLIALGFSEKQILAYRQQAADQMVSGLLGSLNVYIQDADVAAQLTQLKGQLEIANYRLQLQMIAAIGVLTSAELATIAGLIDQVEAGFASGLYTPGQAPVVAGGGGFGGSGGGGGGSTVDELANIRQEIAQWEAQLRDAGMDSYVRQLVDMGRQFELLRERLVAAGGAASELAGLEAQLAVERDRILAEAYQPIEELLDRIRNHGSSPAETMDRLWTDLRDAIDRFGAGELAAGQEIAGIGGSLFDQIVDTYGAGTAAARVLVQQLEDEIAGVEVDQASLNDLIAELIAATIDGHRTTADGLGSVSSGIRWSGGGIRDPGGVNDKLDDLIDNTDNLTVAVPPPGEIQIVWLSDYDHATLESISDYTKSSRNHLLAIRNSIGDDGSSRSANSRATAGPSLELRMLSVQEQQRDLLREVTLELAASRKQADQLAKQSRESEAGSTAKLVAAIQKAAPSQRAGAGR